MGPGCTSKMVDHDLAREVGCLVWCFLVFLCVSTSLSTLDNGKWLHECLEGELVLLL